MSNHFPTKMTQRRFTFSFLTGFTSSSSSASLAVSLSLGFSQFVFYIVWKLVKPSRHLIQNKVNICPSVDDLNKRSRQQRDQVQSEKLLKIFEKKSNKDFPTTFDFHKEFNESSDILIVPHTHTKRRKKVSSFYLWLHFRFNSSHFTFKNSLK